MADLYAVQFSIVDDHLLPRDLSENVKKRISSWIECWYLNRRRVVQLPHASEWTHTEGRDQINISTDLALDNEVEIWSLQWRRNGSSVGYCEWEIQFDVTILDSQVEVIIRRSVPSSSSKLSYSSPDLVGEFVNSYNCTVGKRRLLDALQILEAENIDHFVDNLLLNPSQRLPLLVISTDETRKITLIDANETAKRFVGLTEVFVLKDSFATKNFLSRVGKENGCYNGAVRIYDAGLKALDDIETRKIWYPEGIQRSIKLNKLNELWGQMWRDLTLTSVVRITTSLICREAHNLIRESQRQELEGLRQRLNDVEKDFYSELKEVDKLKREKEDLEQSNEELSRQREIDQTNISVLLHTSPKPYDKSDLSPHNKEFELENFEPKTILEAVEKAENCFDRTLAFHDKAKRSAKEMGFEGDAYKVWKALGALHFFSGRRREAKDNDESLGNPYDVFKERGFEYSSHISSTAASKYSNEYQLDGVPMEEHVKVGNSSNCVRIYFYWDEEKMIYMVGHAGRHKPNGKKH